MREAENFAQVAKEFLPSKVFIGELDGSGATTVRRFGPKSLIANNLRLLVKA
jgi:hypothetical protein